MVVRVAAHNRYLLKNLVKTLRRCVSQVHTHSLVYTQTHSLSHTEIHTYIHTQTLKYYAQECTNVSKIEARRKKDGSIIGCLMLTV